MIRACPHLPRLLQRCSKPIHYPEFTSVNSVKKEGDPSEPRHILTERDVGYRIIQ